jgi:hypothetical protein
MFKLEKIPDQLITNYKTQARKGSPAIEHLKIAAALKLWNDRSYRDVRFDVPLVFGGKTVFVKVLAKNADGLVVGIECASTVRLQCLRKRIELLQACLPPDSYIIVVFPQTAGEQAQKAANFVDEVWVTGKNGKVEQMMFTSTFHKE